MNRHIVRKSTLQEADDRDDWKDKTPAERMSAMWQLALDAWGFKDGNPPLEFQKNVVVIKRGTKEE